MVMPKAQTRVLCTVLFCAGIAALIVTASINAIFGHSLGGTESGAVGFSIISIVVDVSAVCFAAVTGYLIGRKLWVALVLISPITVILAILTLSSVFGWGVSERIGKSSLTDMQAVSIRAKIEAENKLALDQRTEQLKWLRSTRVQTTDAKALRTLDQQINELIDRPLELKTPVITQAFSDAQAVMMAKYFGLTPENVQVGWVALISIALVLIKLAAPAMATALWPKSAGSDSPPQPTRVIETRVVQKEDYDRQALVHRFLSECTRPDPGAKVKPNILHSWFVQWCQKQGLPPMSLNAFGRAMTANGQGRVTVGNDGYYRDLARRDQNPVALKVVA